MFRAASLPLKTLSFVPLHFFHAKVVRSPYRFERKEKTLETSLLSSKRFKNNWLRSSFQNLSPL
jgi:hypothetical protein